MTEPVDDTVTSEEVAQAERNWYEAHYGVRCEEVETRFFMYCHSLEQSWVEDMLLGENPEVKKVAHSTAQRIRQLAGKHYKTVVEAYYKKHPWK